MTSIPVTDNGRRGLSSLGRDIFSTLLTLATLGVAVWALEAAEWVNPQPSFLLALGLGVAGGAALARTRLKSIWAFIFIGLGGLAVSIWQSVALFPVIEGLSSWSRWFEGLTQPSANPVAFVVFLLVISVLAGAFGAWYAVRRRNGWPALFFGMLIVILNLVNLPRDFAFILPLQLILGLALVIQTRWSEAYAAGGRNHARVFVGIWLCVVIVSGAFVMPDSPAEHFNLNIDGGSLYSAIKRNTLNIFSAVPSKLKTVRSSGQEAVSFSAIPDQSEAVRFIISPGTPGYFRTRYYDTYSPAGWTNSPLSNKELAPGQTITDASPLSRAVAIQYEVENAVKTDLILINGQPGSLSIPAVARSLTAPGGNDIMALISPRLLTPYQPYSVIAYLPAVTADDLLKSQSVYPEWITQRYLQLPGNLPPSVAQLSRQLTRGYNSGYAKVLAIKRYLQGLGYNAIGAEVVDGADGVAYFLSSRQGNCVNFASALVVMLRSAGVPARFCQGYLGTEVDEENNLLIRGKDSHAWAEVYFPEYGWIVVEATPGSPADSFDPATPITPGEIIAPGETATPVVPGGEVEDTAINDPSGTDVPLTSQPWALNAMLVLFGAVLLFGGSGTLYLTRASSPGATYTRLGWLGKLFRLPPSPAETPSEYARRLGGRLPAEASEINVIAGIFARTRYGPKKALTHEESIELRRLWRGLSRRLLRRRFGLGEENIHHN